MIARTMHIKRKIYFLLIAILSFVFSASSAFAYERIFINPGTATTTNGSTYWIQFGQGSTNVGGIYVDCEFLGVSEIASATMMMWSTSGNPNVKLLELMSGKQSSQVTLSTASNHASFVFSPPIWCDGRYAILMRNAGSVSNIFAGMSGNVNASHIPGVHAWGYGPFFSNASYLSRAPAIIIEGTFSTSTGGGGCEDCLQANQIIVEDSLNLIAGTGIVVLALLFLVLGVYFSIWLVRTFWR